MVRITRTTQGGLEMYRVCIVVEGKLYLETTCWSEAGARTWIADTIANLSRGLAA